VVRRFLPGAHIAVDADIDQAVAGLRRQQQMIDAKSMVLLPGTGLIIPEGVLAAGVSAALFAAAGARLHGWAWDCPIRTKDTAVAGLRLQPRSACLAVIEELAGVDRHGFRGLVATSRAGHGGAQFHSRRRRRIEGLTRASVHVLGPPAYHAASRSRSAQTGT
jgi:hypothetical protein